MFEVLQVLTVILVVTLSSAGWRDVNGECPARSRAGERKQTRRRFRRRPNPGMERTATDTRVPAAHVERGAASPGDALRRDDIVSRLCGHEG